MGNSYFNIQFNNIIQTKSNKTQSKSAKQKQIVVMIFLHFGSAEVNMTKESLKHLSVPERYKTSSNLDFLPFYPPYPHNNQHQ